LHYTDFQLRNDLDLEHGAPFFLDDDEDAMSFSYSVLNETGDGGEAVGPPVAVNASGNQSHELD
jgi:hypothetical protein